MDYYIQTKDLKNKIARLESAITRIKNPTYLKSIGETENCRKYQTQLLRSNQSDLDKYKNDLSQLEEKEKNGLLKQEVDDQIKQDTITFHNKEREGKLKSKKRNMQGIKRKKNDTKRLPEIYKCRENPRDIIHDKIKIYRQPYDGPYNYFTRICDKIPDYLLEKLENMPNNKGYIFHDVYCYGTQPAEKGAPTVMFEKNRNKRLVHVWDPTTYSVYEQLGQNDTRLIKREYRSVKK